MSDDDDVEERILRKALMRQDLELKSKQSFWESGKALAVIVGALAVIAAGFGLTRSGSSITVNYPPGTIITIPK